MKWLGILGLVILSGCTTIPIQDLNGKTYNQVVKVYGSPETSFTLSSSDITKLNPNVSKKLKKDTEVKSCDWDLGGTCITMYFYQKENEWTFLYSDKGESVVVQ